MTRRRIIFAFSLAALLGSVVALFGGIRDRDYALRGYVDPTRESNLPFALPRLGVNAELAQYTQVELTQHLKLMQQAHVTWVRQLFPWDQIEPQQGQFDWTKWDTITGAVAQYPDLRLIAVLVNSPQWARNPQAPTNPAAPPDDPADFAHFAGVFASRYQQQIDYYQVWDEQNLITGWGGLNPQPADYVALLQAAYTAIRSGDSSATVISGGLSPTVETGPRNISDILYLRAMYAYGARDYMDGVGAKPHGFDFPPTDRTVDANVLNFSRVIALREEMVEHNDGAKPLWASNWGSNHLPDGWRGSRSIWGHVTADQQVEYTLAALDRVEREWPWMTGMALQHWQPAAAPDNPLWGFALIDQQQNPTPLWSALAQRAQPEAASNGLYPAISPYAQYSGVWTLSRFGADIGWLRDSQLDFSFVGQDISLLLRKDNYVAYLYVWVDGRPANAAPHDADGNAYIVLTSGALEPELALMPVAHGLSEGAHTLHVVADRGWDRWAIVGYAVSSGDMAGPYDNQVAVAILTVIVSAVSTIIAGRQVNWRVLISPFGRLLKGASTTGHLAIGFITSLALAAGMLLTWGDGTPSLLRREPVQIGLSVITAGLIYVEPGFLLTLAAGAVLFIVIFNRLDIGVALTLFWAPFFLFPVELFRFSFPMVEIVVLLTGTAWALKMLAAWGRRRRMAPGQAESISIREGLRNLTLIDWAVLSWMLLGCVSLTWANLLPVAITELRVMIIEPALLYLVARTSLTDRRAIVRIAEVLLVAGFVVSVVGLVNYFNPALRITAEGGAQRLTSVYGSPNNVGLFLGRCIPFALAFLVVDAGRWRRIAAGSALIVTVSAILLSQSVGALLLGVPASIVAVVLCILGKRALPVLAGLVVVGVIAFGLALQHPRFAHVLDFGEGSNFFRVRLWQSSLDLIRDHPITGAGLDQFLYVYRGQYIRPDAEADPNQAHPHNFLLDFWIRLGIGGVLVFMALQVGFWKSMRRSYQRHRTRDSLAFAVTIGGIGSMVNLLAHGLIDNSVYVIDLAYVFVVLLALAGLLQNISAIDGGAR